MKRNKVRNWVFAFLKLFPLIGIIGILISYQRFDHSSYSETLYTRKYSKDLSISQGLDSINSETVTLATGTFSTLYQSYNPIIDYASDYGGFNYLTFNTLSGNNNNFNRFYVRLSHNSLSDFIKPNNYYVLRFVFEISIGSAIDNITLMCGFSGYNFDITCLNYPSLSTFNIAEAIAFSGSGTHSTDFIFKTGSNGINGNGALQFDIGAMIPNNNVKCFIFYPMLFDLNYSFTDINDSNAIDKSDELMTFLNSSNLNNARDGGLVSVPKGNYLGGYSYVSQPRGYDGEYNYYIGLIYNAFSTNFNSIVYGMFDGFVSWFSITFTNGVVEPIFYIVFTILIYELFIDLILLLFSALTFMIDFAFKCLDKFYNWGDRV